MINGLNIDLGHNRQHCLNCYPYKQKEKTIRICVKCGKEFPPTAYINGGRRVLTSRKYCLECSPFKKRKFCGPKRNFDNITNNKTHYSTKKRQEIKEKAIIYKGGKCIRCGYNRCHAALEFHHRDPIMKNFQIGGYITNWTMIRKELDKCDLVCANCHRIVHYS